MCIKKLLRWRRVSASTYLQGVFFFFMFCFRVFRPAFQFYTIRTFCRSTTLFNVVNFKLNTAVTALFRKRIDRVNMYTRL